MRGPPDMAEFGWKWQKLDDLSGALPHAMAAGFGSTWFCNLHGSPGLWVATSHTRKNETKLSLNF
jgi:hypothetical protein